MVPRLILICRPSSNEQEITRKERRVIKFRTIRFIIIVISLESLRHRLILDFSLFLLLIFRDNLVQTDYSTGGSQGILTLVLSG